jgi:putative ATPase
MLAGGEDPLFIARRLCILAAEDIGLANPNALLMADATFRIVHSIGMPEARIPLSECAVYLASSPKSNSAYLAIDGALAAVQEDKTAPVPLYLRNAPTSLMKELGYSDGYKYAHDFAGHFVDQEFMPESMQGKVFYAPQSNPQEDRLKSYLQACWPKYYTNKG